MRISQKQARQLSEMVAARQVWLSRIVERLEKLGYTTCDPLLGAAIRARDSVAALRMSAYYDSIPKGAGRPEQ